MLRKLLDFAGRAARVAACAALLAGGYGALAQGIQSPAPVQSTENTAAAAPSAGAEMKSYVYNLNDWALAVALLSLAGVVFLIVTKNKQPVPSALRTAGIDMAPLPKQLSAEQSREVEEIVKRVLRQQGGAPAVQVPRQAQNQPKSPANRATISSPMAPAAPAVPAAAPVASETNDNQATADSAVAAEPTPPAPVGPRRVYVSSAPVNGRFRRNALQEQSAHNSIYELTINPAQPDQATFQVNPDPVSHPRHISSYADVLEPACEFNLPQGAASRIVTEAPGLLRRVDGDDWVIERKARIHFA